MPADESVSVAAARGGPTAASVLIEDLGHDEVFDARSVLDRHPDLAHDKSIVLDLAYEEFCRRRGQGELVDRAAFAGRFRDYRSSLLRLLEVHDLLHDGSLFPEEPPDVAWPAPGESYLGFEIQEEIGRGAFSRVFRATEIDVGGRNVVLKVSRMATGEAAMLGRLQHPHIMPVLSVRRDPPTHLNAICMPYLGRATLSDVLDSAFVDGLNEPARDGVEKTLARVNGVESVAEHRPQDYISNVVRIGIQLADALGYTHDLGVVHRDIKPSNVLLDSAGDALLLDFNLAFSTENAANGMGGTLPYMSPEQLRLIDGTSDAEGKRHATGRISAASDLFSLGATLYELLCGELPFGRLPAEVDHRRIARELLARQARGPEPLRARNPGVNPGLSDVVDRLLAFDAAARIGSADELKSLLNQELKVLARLSRWSRVNRRQAIVLTAAGLLLPAYLGYATVTSDDANQREMTRAWNATRDRKYAAAIRFFSSVLERQSQNASALFGRGRAYLRLNRALEATTDFRNAFRHSGDGRAAACCAFAGARGGLSTTSQIDFYRDAITAGFENAAVHNNLGRVLSMWNGHRESRKHFDASLATGVVLPECLLNLASWELAEAASRQNVPDLQYLENALRETPPSLILYRIAMQTHRMVVLHSRDSEQVARSVESAYEFAKLAVQHGEDQRTIEYVARSADQLARDERFHRLILETPIEGNPETTSMLADPMFGVDGPVAI